MPRPILDEAYIHPAVRAEVAGWQHAIVQEVERAVQTNDVVVVGMEMGKRKIQASLWCVRNHHKTLATLHRRHPSYK